MDSVQRALRHPVCAFDNLRCLSLARSEPRCQAVYLLQGFRSAKHSAANTLINRRKHRVGFRRSEEHTSELQSRQYLPFFPTRPSSDLGALLSSSFFATRISFCHTFLGKHTH